MYEKLIRRVLPVGGVVVAMLAFCGPAAGLMLPDPSPVGVGPPQLRTPPALPLQPPPQLVSALAAPSPANAPALGAAATESVRTSPPTSHVRSDRPPGGDAARTGGGQTAQSNPPSGGTGGPERQPKTSIRRDPRHLDRLVERLAGCLSHLGRIERR